MDDHYRLTSHVHGCRALRVCLLLLIAMPEALTSAAADLLDDLSRDLWAWRAVHQPSTGADIPRIGRPAGWPPDWSLSLQRRELLDDRSEVDRPSQLR